jgi:hypothetical protein
MNKKAIGKPSRNGGGEELKPSGLAQAQDVGSQETRQRTGRALPMATGFVGATILLLACGGIASFWVIPEHAKDVWLVIAPIITLAITGLLRIRDAEGDKRQHPLPRGR